MNGWIRKLLINYLKHYEQLHLMSVSELGLKYLSKQQCLIKSNLITTTESNGVCIWSIYRVFTDLEGIFEHFC